MVLRGLPEAAVARFLPPGAVVAPGALRALHERTAGNPFFLRELVRLLAERGALGGDGAELPALVPDRVREVVGRRLEPLEPATREVLAIAGVVGRPFTIAGVARVGGLGRETVARGARAGARRPARRGAPRRARAASASRTRSCATPSTTSWRPRVRARAARRRSPPCCRSRCDAGGDATAAEAAHHALAAARCGADPQPAWDAVARGGARGRRAAGARRGRRALRAARSRRSSSAPRRAPAERLETTLALAAATFAAGDIEAARRRFRTVAAAARRSGAADAQARAAIGFSEVQRYGAIDDDAIALLQDALDALPPDDSVLRARASARLGLRLDPVTDQARREALLDEGVAMARRLGDADALVSLLSAAALVNWPPERAAARAAATDEVLALAARGARPRGRLVGAHDAAARRARGRATSPPSTPSSTGSPGSRPRAAAPTTAGACSCCRRRARCFAGRLAEGERLAEEAVELNRRHGDDADQEHTVQRARARAGCAGARRTRRSPRCATYAARYPGAAGVGGDARPGGVRAAAGRGAAPRVDVRRRRRLRRRVLRTPDWLCGARAAGRAGRGARRARSRSSGSSPRSPRTPSATR